MCGLVWLQEWIQKDICSKEIGLHAQIMITLLSPIVNIIGGIYIDNKCDIHMNFEEYEANGCNLDLDLLPISW